MSVCLCICHTVAHLTELGEHDNGPTLSVVNHLPEISGRGVHGTLGYDECFLLLVALGAEKRERREKKEKKRKTNIIQQVIVGNTLENGTFQLSFQASAILPLPFVFTIIHGSVKERPGTIHHTIDIRWT